MNSTVPNIQQLAKAAFTALVSQHNDRAKNGFEQIVATGQANTMHWMGLAIACSRLGDTEASMSALRGRPGVFGLATARG